MKKKWPEIVLSSKDSRTSKAISRAVRSRQLRKIAPRIYTSNLLDPPKQVIQRNRYQLLGMLFPKAVISHRSALEGGISPDGNIILSYKYTRIIRLPGLTVRLIRGRGPDVEDTPFLENLYIASRGRAFLENLQITRTRKGFIKTLPFELLEERLDRMVRVYGREELNSLRDQAKGVSKRLKMNHEFTRLDKMIGALLGTKTDRSLKSGVAKACAQGLPYDPGRIELFAALAPICNNVSCPEGPAPSQPRHL